MIGRYPIDAAIGACGMGEVYRAADTKLARDMALKVLPPDMPRDLNRLARFQREARAIAALNHPNIVTIYSVEEADNVHLITVELIEGQPLDRLISANGLPADRTIGIGAAIAEAPAAAHGTANEATLTSPSHTQAGMVMGTPGYMSPEPASLTPLEVDNAPKCPELFLANG